MARTITSAEDVHSMPHKRRGAIVSGARTGTGKILGMVSTGESLGLFCSSFLFRAAENFCHRPGDFFSLPGDVTGLFQLNMLRLRRGGDCFVTSSAVPKPPSSSSSSSSTTVATTDDDEEDDDDDNDDDDDVDGDADAATVAAADDDDDDDDDAPVAADDDDDDDAAASAAVAVVVAVDVASDETAALAASAMADSSSDSRLPATLSSGCTTIRKK